VVFPLYDGNPFERATLLFLALRPAGTPLFECLQAEATPS